MCTVIKKKHSLDRNPVDVGCYEAGTLRVDTKFPLHNNDDSGLRTPSEPRYADAKGQLIRDLFWLPGSIAGFVVVRARK